MRGFGDKRIVGGVVLAVAVVAVVLVALVTADPSAEEVVQAFRDEGLEAGEAQQIDRDADGVSSPRLTRNR